MKTQSLNPAQVRRDGDTQARDSINEDYVRDLVFAYNDGAHMPPVVVYYDGQSYWLADGFHRVKARIDGEYTTVNCNVYKGTQEDARWHAIGANCNHGLRRSNDDKRRAVEMALVARPDWSDRAIAKRTGTDHKTVAAMRGKLEVTGELPQSTKRVGMDGREIDTESIGELTVELPQSDDSATGEFPQSDDETELETWTCDRCGHVWTTEYETCPDCSDEDEAVADSLEDRLDAATNESEGPDIEGMCEPYTAAVNDLRRIKRDMAAVAQDEKNGVHLRLTWTSLRQALDEAKGTIATDMPAQICPKCDGAGCNSCAQSGWWTKGNAKQRNEGV